jgi:ectoine hydroxylase-related dioxygenase (phytanoyl-CoA dioxygenase family)
MTLVALPATSEPHDVLSVLDRDGAVILRELAPSSLMDRILDETAPWFARAPVGQDDFRGYQTRRVGALVARVPSIQDLVLNPLVLASAEGILLRYCARIQLTYTQAIRLGPGETPQPLHRDDEVYSLPPPEGVEWALIGMWAASDFTATNGATLVVPGSHRWPRERAARAEEIGQAIMPKGSLLLHLGSVLHAGGANGAGDDRIGLSVNYALGWLRQTENQILAMPPERARTLPPRLQDLLGYSVHGRILGEVGLEDPRIAVLGQSAESVASYERAAGRSVDRSTLSGYGGTSLPKDAP